MRRRVPTETIQLALDQRRAGRQRSELARELGVHYMTIAQWEKRLLGHYLPTKGRMGIPPEKRKEIARMGGMATAQNPLNNVTAGRLGGLAVAKKYPGHMSKIAQLSVAKRRQS
jgi:hypothetical protein